MFFSSLNYLASRTIGLLGPQNVLSIATGPGGYFQRRAWSWLTDNQMRLPEDVRRNFAGYKWSSDWFVKEWFSRPVHILHVEMWHRVWRLAQRLCRQDSSIVALDDYGCGNGSFIRSSPLVLPGLAIYRGWEFSDVALALLRERYPDTNVAFEKTNLENLVAKPERSIITTTGVLCYFTQQELENWLFQISRAAERKTLIMAETTEYALEYRDASEVRAHDTYNHSYTQLLLNAGFKIIHSEVVLWPDSHPWVIIAAET